MLFAVLQRKSNIWQKSCSWEVGQNFLNQSDCRIFKSTISPEEIDETASFFACWYKFTKIKGWSKIFSWAWFRMGVTNLVSGINLNVSQGWTDGINWIFACWYKFMQMKGQLKIFGVGMVKSRCGQSGYGALKLTVLEEWSNGINWLYACWCRFTKLNTDLKFFGWAWSKMGVASLVMEI